MPRRRRRITAETVRGLGREALAFPGDITDAATIIDCVDAGLERFGRIDILINNVGAAPKSAIEPDASPLSGPAAIWDALYGSEPQARGANVRGIDSPPQAPRRRQDRQPILHRRARFAVRENA